jgi:hypothetical protein
MAEVKPASYPVNLTGELQEPLSRWLWLVKWVLLIPHWIVLALLSVAAVFTFVFTLFAILFTGKYPKGLFDFHVNLANWAWRVSFYGYSALGTDKYPPFSLDPVEYPAKLTIEYPQNLNRWLVLVKWFLAIPHLLIASVLGGGLGVIWGRYGWQSGGVVNALVLIAGIILLVTAKYPKTIFPIIIGMNRWAFRAYAYFFLVTDKYPPFRFEE